MKKIIATTLAAATISLASAALQADTKSVDLQAIEGVLSSYETALNTSDATTALTLYTQDGVFMPQHSLPSVGQKAVRAAYDNVFAAIKLEVKFTVDEIKQIAPNWAFVRTRSDGFVTINATGDKMPEGNQEFFLFENTDKNEWKIARYIFSTTNPPRQ
jgi:uncharacterized protein (TIGR02246 family)